MSSKIIILFLFYKFCLHDCATNPPSVLANYKVLPYTLKDNDAGHYSAEYHYVVGDMVDISCYSPDTDVCISIKIDYTQFDTLMDNFYNSPMSSSTKNIRTGFRTKLKREHDKKTIKCFCENKNKKTMSSVAITFLSSTGENEVCSININGLPGKVMQNENQKKVNYKRFRNVPFYAEFINNDGEEEELDLDGTCFGNKHKFTTPKEPLTNPESDSCVFEIRRAEKPVLSANISTMRDTFNNSGLTMEILNNTNIFVMTLYSIGGEKIEERIYYKFDEGEQLSLKCFKDGDLFGGDSSETSVTNNFNVTDPNGVQNYTIRLNSNDEGKIYECSLKNREKKSLKNIRMEVHINAKITPPPSTPDSSDTTTDTNYSGTTEASTHKGPEDLFLMIAIAVVGACLVLVIIIIVFYRMKKRTQPQEPSSNYENFGHSETTPIPPYPKQWTAEEQPYRNPADFQPKNDDIIYSVPIGIEDTYARPIPKNQRGNVSSPDPTYAELDLPRTGRIPPTQSPSEYATVGEMYAKVLPKGERNKDGTYSNVFPNSPYVNSQRSEYVEPAYCDPHSIKK